MDSPPPELNALHKYTCPTCGAEAVWNPAKHALVCPYCSTVSQVELKTDIGEVHESDLAEALSAPQTQETGWNDVRKTVRCQSCNAISVFDPKRVAQNCDFCGSPALIQVDDIKAPIRPSSLLPFDVADSKVRDDIRVWYGSRWFAPNKLGAKALTDTVKGLYLPYWTFDAEAHADWQAESGEYYYDEDSQGKRQQHTRWSHCYGSLDHTFDDELVPGSTGVHASLLTGIAPFPTTDKLVPYDPGYLTGWVVEQYQIDLAAAARTSRAMMDADLRNLCGKKVPGDTMRNLQVASQYSAQTFKHVLLPVWLLTYTYGGKTYQVAVNGFTGKIKGEYPLSWVKILILTVVVLIALLVFFSLGGNHH